MRFTSSIRHRAVASHEERTNPMNRQRNVVRVTRRFGASPERVFDAWLDPASARRWMFATPTGLMVRAEIDPRVGGTFRFVDRRDGEDVEHVGTYLELDRPRRIVFAFSVPAYSPDADRVTVDIVPLATGCEVTLEHELRPEHATHARRTEDGWRRMLDGLALTWRERPAPARGVPAPSPR
jgi:uncharacterized protein YndB with AHSA1/START domain